MGDNQRNAFILCNRYLPMEWSVRTKLDISKKENKFSFYFQNIEKYHKEKNRINFTVWPKNSKTRRIHLYNVRYNIRALLRRRILNNNRNRGNNICLLSQDLCSWTRRKTIED